MLHVIIFWIKTDGVIYWSNTHTQRLSGYMTEKTIGNNRGIAESTQNISLLFACNFFSLMWKEGMLKTFI